MNNFHHSADSTKNLESIVFEGPVLRKSIFSQHELRIHHAVKERVSDIQPDWITGIFIGCAILLAWNHVFNPARLLQVFKAPFSKRFVNQLIREGNLFNERISFTFIVMFFTLLSLYVFKLNEHYFGFGINSFARISLYLIILAGITGLTILKVVLSYFTGAIFRTRETTYKYLLNQLIFSILISPLLLIFNILLVYIGHDLFYTISLIIVLVIFLIQFIKGFFIGMALTKFSYLLLFVYLCTLEILPLLVVTKIVMNIAKTAVV